MTDDRARILSALGEALPPGTALSAAYPCAAPESPAVLLETPAVLPERDVDGGILLEKITQGLLLTARTGEMLDTLSQAVDEAMAALGYKRLSDAAGQAPPHGRRCVYCAYCCQNTVFPYGT